MELRGRLVLVPMLGCVSIACSGAADTQVAPRGEAGAAAAAGADSRSTGTPPVGGRRAPATAMAQDAGRDSRTAASGGARAGTGAKGMAGMGAAGMGAAGMGADGRTASMDLPTCKDPGAFVLDEVAGQLIALLPLIGAPLPLRGAGLAFALFRALDIGKPWPLRRLEELPGGVGIMADDLAAGALAAAGIVAARAAGWLG